MDAQEIKYIQENRKEDVKSQQFSYASEQKAKKIYGIMHVLEVDKEILDAFKKDMDSGELYNAFHLYRDGNDIYELKIIYLFYKEKTKE